MKKHILLFILFFLIIQSAYSGWHSVMKDLQWMGGRYSAIAAKGDTIYAADVSPDKIYISIDRGKNWKRTSPGMEYRVKSIIIQDSITFAIEKENGRYIFCTTNNGENWNKWEIDTIPGNYYPGEGDLTALEIIGNSWFVGFYIRIYGYNDISGLLMSNDNGKSFSFKRIRNDTSVYINCFKVNSDNVFAGTRYGLYLSKDNGNTWEKTGLDSFDVQSIAVNNNVILAGVLDGGIYYSDDYGTSWENVGLNGMSPVIVTKGDTAFAGTEKGVYISTDKGYSWQQTNLNNALVPSITIDGDNIYVASLTGGAGLQTGIFASSNNGQKWNKIGINGGSNINLVAIKNNTIFAGGNFSVLKLSTNNGNLWQNIGLPEELTYSISSIEFDKDKIFAGTDLGLFFSTDDGYNWENRYSGITTYPSITSLSIKGDSIFAGVSFGYGGVYLTTDWGETWKNVFIPVYVFALGAKGDSILLGMWGGLFLLTETEQHLDSGYGKWKRLISDPEIRCIKTDSKSIFAAGKNGFYKITTSTGLYEKLGQIKKAQAIALEGKKIVVGSADEVYLSTDYGLTWQKTGLNDPYRTPLTWPYVNSLAIKGDTIFAATYSGLYRYIIGDTSTVEDTIETHITQTKTISPPLIFPNPAEHSIGISFYSDQEQPCIITLSNALPQEVFKQEINALKGKNNLTIPTAGLSDGVYFLTVKFKDKTLSQKVMIIK